VIAVGSSRSRTPASVRLAVIALAEWAVADIDCLPIGWTVLNILSSVPEYACVSRAVAG
jgi:hypothetical protein